VTVSALSVAFQRAEDTNMLSDELGCAPAPVTVRGAGNPRALAPRWILLTPRLARIGRHPLELTVALLVETHRAKDALKLLACLLSRVDGARQQHLFFGLARLYAKHGLNKDALVMKLPSLCSMPPDRRTWELLKSMAEVLPTRPLRHGVPLRLVPRMWPTRNVLWFAAVHAYCCRATVAEVHRRRRPGPLHACAPDHRGHV